LDTPDEGVHLEQYVVPELNHRLRPLGVAVTKVANLGYGVVPQQRQDMFPSEADEAARDLAVLSLCADKIDESRPLFFCILGDRYGWLPPAELVNQVRRSRGLPASESCSVTELEIELGLHLAEPGIQPLIFMREPLPYDEMPERVARNYHPKDEVRRNRLEMLKERLRRNRNVRVYTYSAAWDAAHSKVTGLDDFGRRAVEAMYETVRGDWAFR
jgi:hypothetical protein